MLGHWDCLKLFLQFNFFLHLLHFNHFPESFLSDGLFFLLMRFGAFWNCDSFALLGNDNPLPGILIVVYLHRPEVAAINGVIHCVCMRQGLNIKIPQAFLVYFIGIIKKTERRFSDIDDLIVCRKVIWICRVDNGDFLLKYGLLLGKDIFICL